MPASAELTLPSREENTAALERWGLADVVEAWLVLCGDKRPSVSEVVAEALRVEASWGSENAERGAIEAVRCVGAYFNAWLEAMQPAKHRDLIQSLRPYERETYGFLFDPDHPKRAKGMRELQHCRPQSRNRAPRRKIRTSRAKARAPSSKQDDDPHEHVALSSPGGVR
jgi:hypothetical protein